MHYRPLRLSILAASLIVAGAAYSQTLRESFNFTPGQAGTIITTATPANNSGTLNFNSAGGYTLRRIRIVDGNLTREAHLPTDSLSNNRVYLWRPGVVAAPSFTTTIAAANQGAGSTLSNAGFVNAYNATNTTYTQASGQSTIAAASGFDPAGSWSYNWANLTDGDSNLTPDAWFNSVTVQFWDNTPGNTGATNLGTNFSGQVANGALGAFQTRWYQFSIDQDVNVGNGNWLDIETLWNTGNNPVGPSGQGNVDTHIALYRADGTTVTIDDDDGMGRYSALSYGNTTSRGFTAPPAGSSAWAGTLNGVAFNGRDGALTAGTYYLAVGLFSTTFEAGFLAFGGNGTTEGQGDPFDVRINTNLQPVPEPASMAVLGLGALALIRRKRSKKA